MDEILHRIDKLTHKRGFIYALLMIIRRDQVINVAEYGLIDNHDRLISEEIGLLLRYWIVGNDNLMSFPDSLGDLSSMKHEAISLLEELHRSYLGPVDSNCSVDGTESSRWSQADIEKEFPINRRIKEAIFYGGDYLYGFEYLDYLPAKYKYDLDWLKDNKSYNPQDVILIVRQVYDILTKKNREISGLDDEMRAMLEHPGEENKGDIINDFVEYLPFLTPDIFDEDNEKRGMAIAAFCDKILNLFTVKETDFGELRGVQEYLKNFSIDLSKDSFEPYNGPGYFNELQTKPLLRFSNVSYLVPIMYWVYVSAYEVPFYWLMSDKSYYHTAARHRGLASEEIAYDILSPVFGKDLYQDIVIKGARNKDITDIDLLAIVGSVAICFQIKSKKLSETSKQGDMESIRSDFDKAVLAAHRQGIKSKRCILNPSGVKFFRRSDNMPFILPEGIEEVYIVCLTSENYPALSNQIFELAGNNDTEHLPIAFSVFDLRLIAYYLNSPFDFAYYIRQRINTADYFLANNEMCLLGFHLCHKLWREPSKTRALVTNDFASIIDQDYYPKFARLDVEGNTEGGHISNRWRNKDFEELWRAISFHPDPRRTSVIFDLFDMGGDTIDDFMKNIRYAQERVRETGKRIVVSVVSNYNSSMGISFVFQPSSCPNPLALDMKVSGAVMKYENHIDKWITLGRRLDSPYTVDLLMVDNAPWEYDSSMESAVKNYHGATPTFNNSLDKKVGRNDLCPCGSGKKYKNCHGR